jgi:hypothetical protein
MFVAEGRRTQIGLVASAGAASAFFIALSLACTRRLPLPVQTRHDLLIYQCIIKEVGFFEGEKSVMPRKTRMAFSKKPDNPVGLMMHRRKAGVGSIWPVGEPPGALTGHCHYVAWVALATCISFLRSGFASSF